MAPSTTEQSDQRYEEIDLWSTSELVSGIATVQQDALRAVQSAAFSLAGAIDALTETIRGGGRMAYAGAGSSGLIAQMDAFELPGTFGIEAHRVPVILAGGPDALLSAMAGIEDDTAGAERAVDGLGLSTGDALIAVTASGATPFTVAVARRAKKRGALTVGLACAPGSLLLAECDHPILIETPPEIIAGSTRMGAGTAQKCALNILSTGVAVRLGHTYAGLMVNMRPENAKLRARAIGIVSKAAGVGEGVAARALATADWSIKTAIVCCAAKLDVDAARARLAVSGDDIRTALSQKPTA